MMRHLYFCIGVFDFTKYGIIIEVDFIVKRMRDYKWRLDGI